MKKILILIGLFISANVYAQPKQIYVGGDVLTVSGDTLYKNGVFLAELGGGGSQNLSEVLSEDNKTYGQPVIMTTETGYVLGEWFQEGDVSTLELISLGGTSWDNKNQAAYSANSITFSKIDTTDLSQTSTIEIKFDNLSQDVEHTIQLPDKSGTIALLDDITGGGGSDNFPTVDDTLTGNRFLFSDTYNLLFSHASGNAFTLSNTGLSYDIGGNNAISMNSSYNEFKTGNISTYGMLKTTNNTARLYTTDGTNTSTVVAHPKYVELDGKDSTVVKNIPIDTLTYHLGLKGNKVVKTTNPLPYREYVASLTQSGTNAPVATVIFSNLPDSVVWNYSGAGAYIALYYNGGAPINISGSKVVVSMTNNVFYSPSFSEPVYIEAIYSSSVQVFTRKLSTGDTKDDLLGELNTAYGSETNIITIRIYD